MLSGDSPGLQAVHLTVPIPSNAPDARHSGGEWIYVRTGTVDVRIGTDTITLAAGDAIHFPSHTPHRVHNPGDTPAENFLVATPTTG